MRSIRRLGFTLIEMLVVIAIIALLSVLAIGQLNKVEPRMRLRSQSNEIRMAFLGARTRAIRDRQLVKLCIWDDTTPTDRTAAGHYAILECNNYGSQGCSSNATMCQNVDASTVTGLSTAFSTTTAVDACGSSSNQPCNSSPCPGTPGPGATGDSKWCWVSDVSLTANDHAADDVSVAGFYPYGGTSGATINASHLLELTYDDTGALASGYNQPSGLATQGQVRMSNFDECKPGMQGGTFTCTTFQETSWVIQYTLAGIPRIFQL